MVAVPVSFFGVLHVATLGQRDFNAAMCRLKSGESLPSPLPHGHAFSESATIFRPHPIIPIPPRFCMGAGGGILYNTALVARGGLLAGLRKHPPNLIRITAWNDDLGISRRDSSHRADMPA